MAPRSPAARLLVINSGSSSLKYDVWDVGEPSAGSSRLATGVVERIGDVGGQLTHRLGKRAPIIVERDVEDHGEALDVVRGALDRHGPTLAGLVAVGHRVVHGGERYPGPVVVDDSVETDIEQLSALAPLHNPANLFGVRVLRAAYPDVPHVAVFDTSFHATIPPEAHTYAVPVDLARRYGIRRWGFHGTSHQYVSRRAAEHLAVAPEEVGLVVCHVGNGVSVTAVRDGRSVDTSMGLTPLGGLVMGTRAGDLDPAVVTHLQRRARIDLDEVDVLLTQRSGLRGLCGDSDVRTVRARARRGDEAAQLALDVYAHRLRTYVGACLALVPTLHGVVFTAGVGENDPELRTAVVGPLAHLGLRLDEAANREAVGLPDPVRIDSRTGAAAVLVVPTDESAEICRLTLDVAAGLVS